VYPTLFEIGDTAVSSYSVMVLIAYLTAYLFVILEVKRNGYDDSVADWILLAALFGGLGGAKLLFLYQNVSLSMFLEDPLRYLASGLTFYGGLIGACILMLVVGYYKKVSFWNLTDCTAPGLALAYGIGRIGCLLVGDDYGTPTNLPWALSFPQGSPPTNETVHPTQIYDTIAMLLTFALLWGIREEKFKAGWVFSLFLIIVGIERFLVEFIRNTTPSFIEGFSQAQVISIIIFVFGLVNLIRIGFFGQLFSNK